MTISTKSSVGSYADLKTRFLIHESQKLSTEYMDEDRVKLCEKSFDELRQLRWYGECALSRLRYNPPAVTRLIIEWRIFQTKNGLRLIDAEIKARELA